MSRLTEEDCQRYQDAITVFCHLVMVSDFDLVQRYLDQTRNLADGTMDVILPHFMSIGDMHKGQRNMQFLREMGKHLLAVRETVESQRQAA